jgi:hypothetical protein
LAGTRPECQRQVHLRVLGLEDIGAVLRAVHQVAVVRVMGVDGDGPPTGRVTLAEVPRPVSKLGLCV